jgi:hypothetical protein
MSSPTGPSNGAWQILQRRPAGMSPSSRRYRRYEAIWPVRIPRQTSSGDRLANGVLSSGTGDCAPRSWRYRPARLGLQDGSNAFIYPGRVSSSDGATVPWSAASSAAARKGTSDRRCWRKVNTAVSIPSAHRPPAALSAPKLPWRHSTAGRKARSATLLVGSTLSTGAKVHGAGHHFVSSRHSPAAFQSVELTRFWWLWHALGAEPARTSLVVLKGC